MDLIAIKYLTVTFNANGGAPATQTFSNVISGTMLGMIPFVEPARGGMYFAGWYDGDTKYSFTDKIYSDITLTARWQSTPMERYAVFAVAYANATIVPQGMISVMAGDSLKFDFYTDVGYAPVLRVDGAEISNPGSSYVFSNIRSDHSIEVMADNTIIRDATAHLTVHIDGKGDVLYSSDNGATFVSYTTPLPLFDGAEYLLKAVSKSSSYFSHWSGGASGDDPEVLITASGTPILDKEVTAHFDSTSSGFGTGNLAIANLILLILAIMIGLFAVITAYTRGREGTGTGKALRFGALIAALIAVIVFFLTQGFGGMYEIFDEWTLLMAILTAITVVLSVMGVRYDYVKKG
jgi:hypothetical protein